MIRVYCAHCPWEIKDLPNFRAILDYKDKNCPECGKGPLVSEREALVVQMIVSLEESGYIKQVPKETENSFSVRINTGLPKGD